MLRVILADDEQYERNYLEKVIKESYPGLLEIVYKAVDGMDLMEKLEECKPQIVLLDIKMPRMNGLKTAEEVRKRHPDIQIVLISAYSDFSFAKQAIKLGVTDYLLKPYLDSELRETLDKVIARVREREIPCPCCPIPITWWRMESQPLIFTGIWKRICCGMCSLAAGTGINWKKSLPCGEWDRGGLR